MRRWGTPCHLKPAANRDSRGCMLMAVVWKVCCLHSLQKVQPQSHAMSLHSLSNPLFWLRQARCNIFSCLSIPFRPIPSISIIITFESICWQGRSIPSGAAACNTLHKRVSCCMAGNACRVSGDAGARRHFGSHRYLHHCIPASASPHRCAPNGLHAS